VDKEPLFLPAYIPNGWWAVWHTYTGRFWGLLTVLMYRYQRNIYKKGI